MKYIFLLFLFFSIFGFSQREFVFDHCSTYECINGYGDSNTKFKIITFGNSKDLSYSLELQIIDNVVTSFYFKTESTNEIQYKKFENIKIEDIIDGITLTSTSTNKHSLSYKYCETEYDVAESLDKNIVKRVYTIFKKRKRKKIDSNIEVEFYESDVLASQKVNLGHALKFFNCNGITFLSNIIKSYKIIYNKRVVESNTLVEFRPFNFHLYIK